MTGGHFVYDGGTALDPTSLYIYGVSTWLMHDDGVHSQVPQTDRDVGCWVTRPPSGRLAAAPFLSSRGITQTGTSSG
jgi:hypothetical protein